MEIDSRPPWQRDPDAVEEVQRLQRQLRAERDRNSRAWDQGFACAIDMFARGATLEDMRAKVRHPGSVPILARGTRRDLDEPDTRPIVVRTKLR